MSNVTKRWIVTATCLILAGGILFGGVMVMLKWDFTKLSTDKYVTNDYDISEPFSHLKMDTDTADIRFVPSDRETCKVVCYEDEKSAHVVAVQDDTLTIRSVNRKAWYDYIGVQTESPKVTVYLPQTDYASLAVKGGTGAVYIPADFRFESADVALSTGHVTLSASTSGLTKLKTNTGNILMQNASAGALDLSVSTGAITLSQVTCTGDAALTVTTGRTVLTDASCQSLISHGGTGDILLKNVTATENVSISRGTGDVTFDGADAADIVVKTDTGDVTGTLLSSKIFMTQTDTGRIKVPKTHDGGRCEVTTNTGDIVLDIP